MNRSIGELVDSQVRRWLEAQQRLDRPAPAHGQRPMVCISREVGARGLEIARIAAGWLGFDLYERELVEPIASDDYLRDRVLESLSARDREEIERLLDERMEKGRFADSAYLRALLRTLLTVAYHGSGVVVGRGAQYMLRPESTLRVRIYAPLETRVASLVAGKNISPAAARALALHEDAERAAFCWKHFEADVHDPRGYDILLNSAALSVGTCAALVVEAFRAKLPGASS